MCGVAHCFPLQRARLQYQEIPDIKTPCGRYCFSDGIGAISPAVQRGMADRLVAAGRLSPDSPPPSAFQVRLGGIKGMMAVNPRLHGHQ